MALSKYFAVPPIITVPKHSCPGTEQPAGTWYLVASTVVVKCPECCRRLVNVRPSDVAQGVAEVSCRCGFDKMCRLEGWNEK